MKIAGSGGHALSRIVAEARTARLMWRKAHMRCAAYEAGMTGSKLLAVLAALRLPRDGHEHEVCAMLARLGATQSRMSRCMATEGIAA